uniref:Uncharacterized protein n=1 Tax=Pongo abelii TaxID=9601 RepID=H2N647_PONAB
MNSQALVLPRSASSTPGSEMAIINRTNGLDLDTSPVLKTPPKLEGDATDGSFANKHGRHVIGHIDDYSALRQQIAEDKLLVEKGESTERELLEPRTKVSKQEWLLQRTAERLKTANQQKESMEQFIVSQREIPKGSAVYSSLVTLAFQEPCKKRSHQKSLKQQERWACPPFVQLPIC